MKTIKIAKKIEAQLRGRPAGFFFFGGGGWGQRATPLLWAGSRAGRGKITIRGIPNRLNYCMMFRVRV